MMPFLPMRQKLLHTPSFEWLLDGIERSSAIAVKIGLLLLVHYAVQNCRPQFLLYAILLHALFNVPAVLYQKRIIESAAVKSKSQPYQSIWIVKAKRLLQ